MKRWVRYILGGSAAVVILPYSAAVGYLSLNETSLVFAGAGREPWGRWLPADDAGIAWDSVRTRADDGVPVFLVESRVDDSPRRPWAIYFHGNAGLLGSRRNVARYQLLREAGFNVLAVEYRGYGASLAAGSPSEAGLQADARAAWDHLTRTINVEPSRIVVYGWSLGSGPAMYLASEARPAAVITEGAFTSLPDVGATLYPWVPVRLIMRNRFDNLERARVVGIPWLVFHGRNDMEIPFAHAQLLTAAAPSSQLIPLSGDHNDSVTSDRATTLAALKAMAERLSPGS